MWEWLEIMVNPERSFEKTKDGTRDLIQELKLQFRHIVGGVWGVLFPPESLWVECRCIRAVLDRLHVSSETG